MSFRLRRSRNRDFAFRMECLLTSDGAKDNRRIDLHAEEVRRHVQSADIDKASRSQLVTVEAFAVGPERILAVDSRRHISPMCWRQHFPGCSFELEDGERVRGLVDHTRRSLLSQ